MSDITFVKTRYQDVGYASYNDLWKMVELAGYPIVYVDQIDAYDPAKTYIITPLNGEWLTGWPDATAQIIHWELEWRTDERKGWLEPPGVRRVWASDAWFAQEQGFEYVPMGSDYRLNEVGSAYPADKRYDVSLLSYQTGRRQVITQQLEHMGLRLAPVSNLWGRQRSVVLLQSRVMVHVHQHDHVPAVATLRWPLAAAHGLPMITETVRDRGIFGYTHMMQADYSFLADFTRVMLDDNRQLHDYAQALQGLLCEQYAFRKVVESHV